MKPIEILESIFLTLEHVLGRFGYVFYWLGIWTMNVRDTLVGCDKYKSRCLICNYPANGPVA